MQAKDSVYKFFSDMTFMKVVSIFLTPILSVLVSVHAAIFLLAIAMTIDLITGIKKDMIVKNRKFNLFKKSTWLFIESWGLRKTFRKSYEYFLGVLIFAGVQSVWVQNHLFILFGRPIFLTELVLMILFVIEVHSIFENLSVIRPDSKFIKVVQPFIDKVKNKIIDKVKALFK